MKLAGCAAELWLHKWQQCNNMRRWQGTSPLVRSATADVILRPRVMHHAGLSQLSRLSKLQHLSLSDSFISCTHNGLDAALATMTGIAHHLFVHETNALQVM